MTPEERDLRESLERLADHEGGRRLLQLSLRGIESDGRALTSGCWWTCWVRAWSRLARPQSAETLPSESHKWYKMPLSCLTTLGEARSAPDKEVSHQGSTVPR